MVCYVWGVCSILPIACMTLRSSHIVLGCHQSSASKSGPKTYLDRRAKDDFRDLDSTVVNIVSDSLRVNTEL